VDVAHAHAAGLARWPGIDLPAAEFAEYLADHEGELHAEDAYLACACVRRVPGAAEALAEILRQVPSWVLHIDASPAFGDEVRQQLAEKLLVGGKIADYAGRGALVSWLRVAAVRTALNLRAKPDEKRRHWDPETVIAGLATAQTPEHEVLRTEHAHAFAAALREAVATLPNEDRVLLRMYFAGGQSTHRIAAVLRVNHTTASRRLAAVREAVYDETRRLLESRLKMGSSEFASLARAVLSQLDVSLTSLLQ
jgi:RNA polymerase sigma-70 factor, ECF subfamily